MEDEVLDENVLDLEELEQEKTRGEIAYGDRWKKKLLNSRKIDNKDVLYIQCPIHPWHLMTPVKIGSSNYADRITYQCHAVDEFQRMCLMIIEVISPREGSMSFIKPGDILAHESWKDVIDEVQKINRETRIKSPHTGGVEEVVVPFMPPNPWTKKGTIAYIVWETFWENVMQKRECSVEDVQKSWIEKRGETQMSKLYNYTLGTYPLVNWMRRRSGYVVKLYGDIWRVVGRSEGEEGEFPWSNDAYREAFYGQGSLSLDLTNEPEDEEDLEDSEDI